MSVFILKFFKTVENNVTYVMIISGKKDKEEMKNEKVMERAVHNRCIYDSLVLLRNLLFCRCRTE